MNLNADYHTHTVFSHGKGDVIDNARAAAEKGLKELGIADHGFVRIEKEKTSRTQKAD